MAKKTASKSRSKGAAPATPSTRQVAKLDRQIVELLNERAELVRQRAAKADSVDAAPAAEFSGKNAGPLSDSALRAIFREIDSGTRAVLEVTRVAFLGPEYTFSHLAAIESFGQSAVLTPVGTIASVFEEVERGQADYGIVPIENSTDGRITEAMDCLRRTPLRVCREVPLRIHHCLLGRGDRKDVRTVYSKPQALSQCRNWLSKHLPQATLTEVASTGEAARRAGEEPGVAAIASLQAGAEHGLGLLARNIEDNTENITRFAVLGPEIAPKTGSDKTSVLLEIDHQPGALADAMNVFKRAKLNLTWIESFPVAGQRGRYQFFVEFLGHPTEMRVRKALASLEKKALRVTVLGSYAQADPIG